MKLRINSLVFVTLLLTSTLFAQQKTEPQHKLVQFQMALLNLGPNWQSTKQADRDQILRQHIDGVTSLLGSGKAVLLGTIVDDPSLFAVIVFRMTPDEANMWSKSDPAVKAGLFAPAIHPWWSEDIFKKSDSPLKYETVYLGFLKKGPNRKDGDDNTTEVQNLQKAHIANINRLAETKKLVVAGPFGDDGELRGIFVFRVGSLKEAEELAATDPMVKIDRLRLELYEWHVPVGVIP